MPNPIIYYAAIPQINFLVSFSFRLASREHEVSPPHNVGVGLFPSARPLAPAATLIVSPAVLGESDLLIVPFHLALLLPSQHVDVV